MSQGNFINDDNNTSFDGFDEGYSDDYIPEEDAFIEEDSYSDSDYQYSPDIPNQADNGEEKEVNLGYKTVGAILAGIFIIVAIILICMNNIHIKKKPANNTQTAQTTQATSTTQASTEVSVAQKQNGVSLIEVGSDVKMTYNENILETSGVITSKKIFLDKKQLLYCIGINVVGNNINYYCNYGSYTSVSVGDQVTVKYQLVDDDYISVFEITR